jgi:hypothetical protein
MRGKLFTEEHYDTFPDTGERVGYEIKGYDYRFLGENLQFTKPTMPFINVLHATIEKKCSREIAKLFHSKTHKASLKLKILSVIEMLLRKIVYKKKKRG